MDGVDGGLDPGRTRQRAPRGRLSAALGVLGGGELVVLLVSASLALAGVGIVATAVQSLHWLELLFQAFMNVGLAAVTFASGVYLRRSSLRPGDRWVVALWYVGGIAFLGALLLWANLPELLAGEETLRSLGDEFIFFGNLGGVLGLVAGHNRARANQNRRLTTEVEAKRETLEFLNHLLRHNVLNSAQAIEGSADLLGPYVESEGEAFLDQIERSNRRIASVVEDVRVLMHTLAEEVERRPVDLSALLEAEVTAVRASHPEATVDCDLPSDVYVAANSLLGAVFDNLLANAVEHGDAEPPRVSVALEADETVARVRIADDGPGIPDQVREAYFGTEPGLPDDGGPELGFYLVAVLVEKFDGEVRIEEGERAVVAGDAGADAPRESVVVVELPLASAPPSGASRDGPAVSPDTGST